MEQRVRGVIVIVAFVVVGLFSFFLLSEGPVFGQVGSPEIEVPSTYEFIDEDEESGPPQPGLTLPLSNPLQVADLEDVTENERLLLLPSSQESTEAAIASPALCRLGINQVSLPLDQYSSPDLAKLRADWYFNWGVRSNPPTPNDIRYAQSIFVKQWKWDGGYVLYDADAPYAVPYTYTVSPSIAQIKSIATANPGYLWLVGNEIERRDYKNSDGISSSGQNEILPELYAVAYHEIYTAIKAADPTARVANGSIIVPTPLRLEYMSRIWDEYMRLYGTQMPVDVWQIHTYFSPEKRNSWGIDIPAGIDDVTVGMFYYGDGDSRNTTVNKDVSYVPTMVQAFRSWMKERGQQNKPLFITEFGVSMPDWVMEGEFTPERIRDEYMIPGLGYLLQQTDTSLGYPADDYHLVQSVWWWSLDGDGGDYEEGKFYQNFNGNLFWSGIGYPTHSPNSKGISTLGQYWINYVSPLATSINLSPLVAESRPIVLSESGDPVTITLHVELSNSGNIAVTQPFTVNVTDVENGTSLGSFAVDELEGCGEVHTADFVWTDVAPGAHSVQITVDTTNTIVESNENDNQRTFTILVPTKRVVLPIVLKSF